MLKLWRHRHAVQQKAAMNRGLHASGTNALHVMAGRKCACILSFGRSVGDAHVSGIITHTLAVRRTLLTRRVNVTKRFSFLASAPPARRTGRKAVCRWNTHPALI